MNKLRYAMAMLATGGVVSGAASANATTATQTFNYSPTDFNSVTIGGSSTPQFEYGPNFKSSLKSSYPSQLTTNGNSGIGLITMTPGLPGPGETYSSSSLSTGTNTKQGQYPKSSYTFASSVPSGGEYAHLSFDIGSTQYIGTAVIDGGANLQSISYEPAAALAVSAAPEPDAWLLLIAGAGITGVALRGRRSRQAAAIV